MGCYQNRGRALGDILLGVAGFGTIKSKLDACRKKAASLAVTLFGLDDKECWTGQNASDTYYKYGTSGQCTFSKNHEVAIGGSKSESIYVYLLDNKGKYNCLQERPSQIKTHLKWLRKKPEKRSYLYIWIFISSFVCSFFLKHESKPLCSFYLWETVIGTYPQSLKRPHLNSLILFLLR